MNKVKVLAKEIERLEKENLYLKEKLKYIKPTPERNMYFIKLQDGNEVGPFCKSCSENEFSNIRVSDRADVEKGWDWKCVCCKKVVD